jgi:hypothetical protein
MREIVLTLSTCLQLLQNIINTIHWIPRFRLREITLCIFYEACEIKELFFVCYEIIKH